MVLPYIDMNLPQVYMSPQQHHLLGFEIAQLEFCHLLAFSGNHNVIWELCVCVWWWGGGDSLTRRVCAWVLSCFNHVQLFVTLWTIVRLLFCPWHSPGKNTGVGCCVLLQGNLPDPGIEPASLTSSAFASGFFTTSITLEAPTGINLNNLLT